MVYFCFMRSIHLLVIVFCFSVIGHTQHDSLPPRVMIIPFNPDYYFSDSDEKLAEYNQTSIPKVREQFRQGLFQNIDARILSVTGYQTVSLYVESEELNDKQDLQQVYYGLRYGLANPKRMPQEPDTDTVRSWNQKLKSWLTFKKKPRQITDEEDVQIKALDEPYMNVTFNDPEMITWLSIKYDTDYFLFINQFEVVTNYEQCLDRSVNRFQRSVKVHYSLYDKNANLISGQTILATTTDSELNLDNILLENFTPVADFIARELPEQKVDLSAGF
jgi:hypothetical protein